MQTTPLPSGNPTPASLRAVANWHDKQRRRAKKQKDATSVTRHIETAKTLRAQAKAMEQA